MVSGQVDSVADIRPRRVMLAGIQGKPLKTRVSITPGEKYPFKIVDIRSRYGKHLKLNLEKSEHPDKLRYFLNIENTLQTPGRYNDVIYLETDSEIRPTLQIFVSVSIVALQQSKKE
jgi:hypothetical protein